MKTLIGMTLTAVLIGAAGCTTVEKDKYAADQPPPLANRDRAPAALPALTSGRQPAGSTTIEPVKLTGARTPVTADDIDEANVHQSVSRLEGELKTEGRASAKAGQ
jgi:hypothetical protein